MRERPAGNGRAFAFTAPTSSTPRAGTPGTINNDAAHDAATEDTMKKATLDGFSNDLRICRRNSDELDGHYWNITTGRWTDRRGFMGRVTPEATCPKHLDHYTVRFVREMLDGEGLNVDRVAKQLARWVDRPLPRVRDLVRSVTMAP